LVEAEARVACVVGSRDWLAQGKPALRLEHLTAEQRAGLAAHWSKLGQMEHASIAAFARFTLQLLALGAPAALVDASAQALADEAAHTRLCFEIASAYAGRALGPGPLDVQGSLTATELGDVVDLVIVEGCFGESSAALEALEAAESAEDLAIREAYARIAEDEQRHAELAFRFVGWALKQDGADVRTRIDQALSSASKLAASEVVVPCLHALLRSS
jgi:hypothetical protein